MIGKLQGKKTYLAGIAALLIAIGAGIQAYVNGMPIEYDIIVDAFIALAILFLRKGIKDKA